MAEASLAWISARTLIVGGDDGEDRVIDNGRIVVQRVARGVLQLGLDGHLKLEGSAAGRRDGTLKTPGEISVTVPMATVAMPALLKSAAVTVLASMSSLKVTVFGH